MKEDGTFESVPHELPPHVQARMEELDRDFNRKRLKKKQAALSRRADNSEKMEELDREFTRKFSRTSELTNPLSPWPNNSEKPAVN